MCIALSVRGASRIAALIFGFAAATAVAETNLTVYTALEAEDLKKYAERFNQEQPDVKIQWVRDSTGIVTAKLLAEKDNPQADAIWGLAATSLLILKSEGMLEPYAPNGLEKLDARFRDSANPPSWVGMDAWGAALCVNSVEMDKLKLVGPKTWQDLTKPEYRGHIVMPNPNSSGTGYLDVSSWLQMFGEDKGWAYMDALHQNINQYLHSGSKPCKLAATGEAPIGISFAYRAARLKADGAPLDIVIPSEGIGWDMEAAAIVKGTKNLAAAKMLLDWAVSENANKLYNEGYAEIAIPALAKPVQYYPAEASAKMIKNDFEWAAQNRERILKQWQNRYDAKSEPKK